MAWLVALIFLFFFLWFLVKPYIEKFDTIRLYTGGNGSGKTLFSVIAVKIAYKKLLWKVRFHNILHPKDKWEKPLIFSNIGLKICGQLTYKLDYEHVLLLKALPPRCVVFIDEINLFLDQMKTKFPNTKNVSLFTTLFRHFTKGGYLILNTQNVNKVHYLFRYCANESLNLFGFKKIFRFVAWTNCRHVSIGDDIKTIEVGHKEDNSSRLFCLPFKHFGSYDTYTYSDIYVTVPYDKPVQWYTLKTMRLFTCPTDKKYEERILFFSNVS